MDEIIFAVKESPEGSFEARSLGFSIFTEADAKEEASYANSRCG